MLLKSANIFFQNHFQKGDVLVENGRIVDVCIDSTDNSKAKISAKDQNNKVIDCKGKYLFPGFVDIHFHGSDNCDFCDASVESIKKIAKYQAKNGILAICPATMTYTEDILSPVMISAAEYKKQEDKRISAKFSNDPCSNNNELYADLVGINMEGPFISPKKVGAQNPDYVQAADGCMIDNLDKLSKGLIKLIDIAPEEADNLHFIKQYSDKYSISIAHTCTDYETACKAFKNGANHVTHLYNAMPGITHREPGPIVAAKENNAFVELICDGNHVHNSMIKFTFDTFSSDKVCMISDSCSATGMPDGEYSLGGQAIIVKDHLAFLKEFPDTIAASATNLYECFLNTVNNANVSLEDALKSCTINPCKSIGIDNDYGSISKGKIANLIIANTDLSIDKIISHGNIF